MKKNIRNIILGFSVVAAGIAITVYSCEKETVSPDTELTGETLELKSVLPQQKQICSEVIKKRIYRGSNREIVGFAYLYNDPETFYVLLFAEKGHYFKEAYLEAQSTYKDFPLNSDGNLAFTDFSYSITSEPLSNVRRFVIPIGEVKDKKFMSVMAQVRHSRFGAEKQRAWVAGRVLGNTVKGQGFVHEVELCKTPPADIPAEEMATPDPEATPADNE